MLTAPSAWAEVPAALAAAPDSLGLARVRLGMRATEIVAIAPDLKFLHTSGRTSVDLKTKWVLSGPVELRGGCFYRAEVGGNEAGATDIILRLTSENVAECSRSVERLFENRFGGPRVQMNSAPAVLSTYYVWDGRSSPVLGVYHFYGNSKLTWLSITLVDKRSSLSVVR